MTAKQEKLFDDAYRATVRAKLTMDDCLSKRSVRPAETICILHDLRAATSAWQAFERLAAGQPEPKKGE